MQYLSVVSGWFGLAAPWGTFIGFLRRLSGRVSHSSHSIKVCANLSVQSDGGRGGGSLWREETRCNTKSFYSLVIIWFK